MWRPEWQTHLNAAGAVARVVVTTGDPRRTTQLFRGLFGGDAIAEREGEVGDRRGLGAGRARTAQHDSSRRLAFLQTSTRSGQFVTLSE